MTVEELQARLRVVAGNKYQHHALKLTGEEYDALRGRMTLGQWTEFELEARAEGLKEGVLIGGVLVYSEPSDMWPLILIADCLTAAGK